MTSYIIEPQGDILHVDFNPDVSVSGVQVVKDIESRLHELSKAGLLGGGKLLKIKGGRISVLGSYVLAHHLSHLYGAIAVSDPRLSAYIVVSSTTSDYPLASRIDFKTGKVTPVQPKPRDISSFLVSLDDGILRVGFNPKVSADGDQIVRDTEAYLNQLLDVKELKGGSQPLLINGRASVLASFVLARQLAHLYSVVAVYDPKIGEAGLDKYVVVISHGHPTVGDTIEQPTEQKTTLKVALCGSLNTGKTCFREGLKQALIQLADVPESYVISGCPDGDGAWFSPTARNDPDLARRLKEEYKAKFTPEFAEAKARDIRAIKTPILVFDVGGKLPSHENEIIMAEATHAVLLVKNDQEIHQWQEFCDSLNLKLIAVLYSDYEAKEDKLISESDQFPFLVGKVHHLDRGEDTSTRPMIQKVAQLIVRLTPAGVHIRNSNFHSIPPLLRGGRGDQSL